MEHKINASINYYSPQSCSTFLIRTFISSSSFFPKKHHRRIIANIYLVLAYVLDRCCSKCFPYKDSFNLYNIFEVGIIINPCLRDEETWLQRNELNLFKITQQLRDRGRIRTQAVSLWQPCFSWLAHRLDGSYSLSAHVWESGETHLFCSHKIRKLFNHFICGSRLGQTLKCKGSYYAQGFSVWLSCLKWLMNPWKLCANCISVSTCVVPVSVRVGRLQVSCTLSDGSPPLSLTEF